jgi:hypothetical protein
MLLSDPLPEWSCCFGLLIMQDCIALLAYEEPEKSPMFFLLSMDHRQSVADSLNRAILGKRGGVLFNNTLFCSTISVGASSSMGWELHNFA